MRRLPGSFSLGARQGGTVTGGPKAEQAPGSPKLPPLDFSLVCAAGLA